MVRDVKVKPRWYQASTRCTRTVWLAFFKCLACGLTNHLAHCLLETECIYNGLVYMFVASLVEIDWDWVVYSLVLHTYRGVWKKYFHQKLKNVTFSITMLCIYPMWDSKTAVKVCLYSFVYNLNYYFIATRLKPCCR